MGNRVFSALIGFAVALAFGVLLYAYVDPGEVWRAVAQAHTGWIALAMLPFAAGLLCRAGRWHLMLRAMAPSLRLRQCLVPFLVSLGLNNILPLRAGDVARALAFRRELGCSGSAVVGTLIVERALDLLVLLLVAMIVAQVVPLPKALETAVTSAAVIGMGCGLAIMLMPSLGRRALRLGWTIRLLQRSTVARRLAGHAELTLQALAGVPGRAFALLVLSLVGWGFEMTTFALVARAFDIDVGLAGPVAAFGLATLSTLLPGAPGYFGQFEFFGAQGLMSVGVAPATAAAAMLTTHLVIWLPTSIIALAWILRRSAFAARPRLQG